MKHLTNELIAAYASRLTEEEKAKTTIEKYVRDIGAFAVWLQGREVNKSVVVAYKEELIRRYAAASVNGALSSLNGIFAFLGWTELQVKHVRIQRRIFASTDMELTKSEYERLLQAAKQNGNDRLYLLMQTFVRLESVYPKCSILQWKRFDAELRRSVAKASIVKCYYPNNFVDC